MVVEDLMNIKISYNIKNSLSRKKTASKSIEAHDYNSNENKENVPKTSHNIQLPEEIIKPRRPVTIYSEQIVSEAESWIKNELGYEHSLNKSKKIVKIL